MFAKTMFSIATFENWSTIALVGFLVWAIAGTLLWSGAAALTYCLRSKSAQARHHIWGISTIAIFFAPLLVALLPVPRPWNWSISANPNQIADASTSTKVEAVATRQSATQFNSDAIPNITIQNQTSIKANVVDLTADQQRLGFFNQIKKEEPIVSQVPKQLAPTATMAIPVEVHSISQSSFWQSGIILVWLVGSALSFLAFSIGLLQIYRVRKNALLLTDGIETEVHRELSQKIGLRQNAKLFTTPQVQVALLTGVIDPAIIMPIGYGRWTMERLRVVITHELMHLKRNDLIWEFFAMLTLVPAWFHPLGWFAIKRLRIERELACDDAVLLFGEQPVNYAEHLVEVAAELQTRNRGLPYAIAMAGVNPIEQRVRSILNPSTWRAPLGRMLSLGLMAGVALMIFLAAALSPSIGEEKTAKPEVGKNVEDTIIAGATKLVQNRAVIAPAPLPKDKKDKEIATKGIMKIQVLNNEGNPLAKTMISVNTPTNEKNVEWKHDYETNASGIVEAVLPKTLMSLQIWARKEHFVPLYSGWRDQIQNLEPLPDKFTFHMQKGTIVGGVVKNDARKPIVGAKIEVRYEGGGKPEHPQRSTFNTWLAEGNDACVTDENGKWSLGNVPPGDDVKLELKLAHKDYIHDEHWGDYQRKQAVTLTQLREATATITMKRGFVITGKVTDDTGKPVKKAVVVWGERPYLASGPREVYTDANGAYTIPPLEAGRTTITVVAKDWMPELRKVELNDGLKPLDFALKRGKTLKLRFVDGAGKELTGVSVSIKRYRGDESLYNIVHSKVLPTRIPQWSGKKSTYEWTWAPDDAVEYGFWKEGFASTESSIVADGEEHVVVLNRPFGISGSVTDTTTGKPIENFLVVPIVHYSDYYTSVSRYRSESFKDGKFTIELDDTDRRHDVQIEVPGYKTWRNMKKYKVGDPNPTLEIKLQPSDRYVGKIVNQNHRPVKKAEIYVATKFQELYLSDLKDRQIGLGPGKHDGHYAKADNEGKFEIVPQIDRYGLVVISDEGYAQIERGADELPGELTVQPWAKVRGKLMQSGEGVNDQSINLRPVTLDDMESPRFHISFHARTSPDGSFEFKRVPSVPCSVMSSLHWSTDSELKSSQSMPLDLKPGDDKTILLGGKGINVKGKLVLENVPDKFDYHFAINYLVAKKPGCQLPVTMQNGDFNWKKGWNPSWNDSPNGNTFRTSLHYFFVKPDSDGRINISGVEPGEYEFVVRLYGDTGGCLVHPAGENVIRFTVKNSDKSLDLGELNIPSLAVPKIGDVAANFEFEEQDGTKSSLANFKGKYVLLDFWASWCEPCVTKLDQIEAVRKNISRKHDLVVIGANLNAEKQDARNFLKKKSLPWHHALLGDWSDTEVPQKYAVSGIPELVLISPDGTIAAMDLLPETVEVAIDKHSKSRKEDSKKP